MDNTLAVESEIRSVLNTFRKVLGAGSSALLLYDRDAHLFRVRASVPRKPCGPTSFPAEQVCALSRVLDSGGPAVSSPVVGGCGQNCTACSDLFGALLVLAVPVAAVDGERAVVAAFGSSGQPDRQSVAIARRLARHLGDFMRLGAAAQQAERRARRLKAINEIAANLTSVIDAELLFPKILRELTRVIRCDTAALYLFDHEERRLHCVTVLGRGFSKRERLVLDETAWDLLPGMVFRSREPVVANDLWGHLPRSTPLKQLPTIARLKSALWVPILYDGASLGAIGFGSRELGAFGDQDLELVVPLANHAAIAIANAQLYREVDVRLQSRLRDLVNLIQVGRSIATPIETRTVLQNVVRGTAEAFKSSGSAILLKEGEGALVVAATFGIESTPIGRRIPVEGSASGRIAGSMSPLIVPSVREASFDPLRYQFEIEGIESFMGVPLLVQGAAIGTLNVYSRLQYAFGATDVELLQGLAAQAAIAIDHAGLYESVTREKAKLEAIVESLNEGLVLADTAGTIVYANRRFLDVLGIPEERLGGYTIDSIWNWVSAHSRNPGEAREKLGSLELNSARPVTLTLEHPSRRDLEVHGFSVELPDGGALGRGYLARDITQEAEIERLKASILSTVSHELRTPLAAIKGFATSLLRTDTEWDQDSRRDFIEQIDREADRLGVLVRNLLDMSRLDSGAIRLDREWCDFGELLDDVVARMAPIVSSHRIRVSKGSVRVLAFIDRRYMERVVWNLVENAVKYSPRGSIVDVGIAGDGEDALITVSDEGVGIRPEEREKVFERFYRGSGARGATGLGLGLAICRGIVEAHGGTIAVESAPRRGARFVVCVPAGTTSASAAA